MKFQKIICISFFLIIISLLANVLLTNRETPISIKFFDFSFKLLQLYTGLGSPDFSREKYNKIRDILNYLTFYSQETHIEHLKVPSLFDDHQIDVNLYINKTLLSENAKLPTIIYIHGGGWVMDYSDLHFIEKFTENGYIFIEVKYRLAPENKFPVPLDDCFSVVNSEIIYKYSDKNRLALFGDSAGGNLVSALILMMKDRKSEVLKGIQINFLFYPGNPSLVEYPSHKKFEDGYIINKKFIDFCRRSYVRQEIDYENPYLNPLKSKNLSGWPEIYAVLSTRDIVLSEGEIFISMLKEAGNILTVKYYEIEHGFLIFPIKETDIAIADILEFLKLKKF